MTGAAMKLPLVFAWLLGLSLTAVTVSDARIVGREPKSLTLCATINPALVPISSPATDFLMFHLPFADEFWPSLTSYFQLTAIEAGNHLTLARLEITCRVRELRPREFTNL